MTSRCPKRRRKAEWMWRDGGPAGRHERERRSLRNEANEGEWIATATPPWSKSPEEIRAQPDSLLALHGDVVYCSHLVKVEEPVAGYPVRIPVAPEVARRAMDLVRQFPGCFWFWKEEPSISFRDDVESVIRNLRQYGDKSAWSAAQELRQCL